MFLYKIRQWFFKKSLAKRMANPNIKMNDLAKAFKRADISMRDAEGQFKNTVDILNELSAKWNS